MVLFASHGSLISRKAQRPKRPSLLMAGTQRLRAVSTFAAFSGLGSPETSMMRLRGCAPSGARSRTMKSGMQLCASPSYVYGT